MERWFYIDIDYACFAICSKDNIITQAPPIASWMIGKTLHSIKPFLRVRHAIVKELIKN